jgi:hypothetical protein
LPSSTGLWAILNESSEKKSKINFLRFQNIVSHRKFVFEILETVTFSNFNYNEITFKEKKFNEKFVSTKIGIIQKQACYNERDSPTKKICEIMIWDVSFGLN